MDGIAAGRGPKDRGSAERVRRWLRLNIRRRPRLKQVVAVVMMVTVRRFLSDGESRKADRQSGRSDKAFDHGSTLPANKRRRSPGVGSNPLNPARWEGGNVRDDDGASGNVEKLAVRLRPEPDSPLPSCGNASPSWLAPVRPMKVVRPGVFPDPIRSGRRFALGLVVFVPSAVEGRQPLRRNGLS